MRKQRIISKAVLGTIFLALCQGAGAAGSVVLSLSSSSGSRGNTVQINTTMIPATGIMVSSLQFDISYNTTLFSLIQTTIGPAASAAGKDIYYNPNANRFVISGLNSNAMQEGIVAILQFRIASNAPGGTYPLMLSNVVASSPTGSGLTAEIGTNGSILVQTATTIIQTTLLPTTSTTSTSSTSTSSSSTIRSTTTTLSSSAVPSQTIRISSCGSVAGGLAEVEIGIYTTKQVSALQMDLTYPSLVTKFLSASIGPAAQAAGKTLVTNTVGANIQRLVITGLNQNPIESGVIVIIQFRNLQNISAGRHALQVSNIAVSSPQGFIYPNVAALQGVLEILPAPALEDISPAAGSPGMLVTLSGSNLGGCRRISKVIFRGSGGFLREVAPLESGLQQVVAAVPGGADGSLRVSLQLDQQKSNELDFLVDPRIPFAAAAAQTSQPTRLSSALIPADTAINPRSNRAYIVDSIRNRLAVMDLLSGKITGDTKAETGAAKVVINGSTGDILVTNTSAGTLSVFQDTPVIGLSSRATIRVGRSPLGVAVDERANIAVVANSEDNTISIIPMLTRIAVPVGVGGKPTAIAVDSVQHHAFVLNERDGTVSQVDLTALRLERSLTGFGNQARTIAFHVESGVLLVGGPAGLQLRWVDTGKSALLMEGQSVSEILLHPTRWLAEAYSPETRTVTTVHLGFARENLILARLGRTVLRETLVSGAAMNPHTNQALFLHPGVQSAGSGNENIQQTAGFSRLTLPVSLYFPRLLFRFQDFLGLAFSNPSQECCQTDSTGDSQSDTTALQITAMSASGSKLDLGGTANPQNRALPWQGQLARLDFELFGNDIQASTDAWIYAGASNPSIKTIFLSGDFTSSLVGAEENGILAKELILPAVRYGEQVLVGVVNPSPFSFSVTLELVENNGQVRQTIERTISSFGFLRLQLNEAFSRIGDWKEGGYVRVRGNGPIRAYEQFVPTGKLDPAGLNGVSSNSGSGDLVFAHFASGQGFETRLGLINMESQPLSVTATARNQLGQIIGLPKPVLLPASGRTELNMDSLGLPTQGLSQGWLRVVGSGRMTGYVTYSSGGAMAAVACMPEPRSQLIFSHVAESGTGYYTGLALANTNSEPVGVRLYVFRPDGTLIAATSAPIQIPVNGRTIGLLNQLVGPEVIGQAGGYIRVMADLPIHGIEIFGTDDNRAFANIPAQ